MHVVYALHGSVVFCFFVVVFFIYILVHIFIVITWIFLNCSHECLLMHCCIWINLCLCLRRLDVANVEMWWCLEVREKVLALFEALNMARPYCKMYWSTRPRTHSRHSFKAKSYNHSAHYKSKSIQVNLLNLIGHHNATYSCLPLCSCRGSW